MPHVYTSEASSPSLPRQSIFHYLFPEVEGRPSPCPPSAPQLVDALTGRTISREDVRINAQRLAGGLRKLGLKRGDVVGVVGTNSIEWCNAVFGSLAAGLRVSPMNYAYTPPELLHQLSHSGSSLVFVSQDILPTLLKTLELGRLKGYSIPSDRIILLTPDGKSSEHKYIEDIWAKEPMEPERFEKGDEVETAWLCYSSGTTGVAKGVETTHFNMTSQLQALSLCWEPLKYGRDTTLGYLPFSHAYGLTCTVHHSIVVGIPLVILPRFEETAFFRTIEKYKITWILIVPPVLVVMRNSTQAEKYDLSSLRGAISAAAPLSEELCRAVEKKIKPLIITQAYGLTETSPISHMTPLTSARGRQSKIGRLIPTFRARLVDPETGKDVDIGQAGELWLQSESVMKGYYHNPEATTNTFSSEKEEGGRWFKTGDSAWVDEEGFFQIADRLKELIKYKGFQVAPAELEALLLTHPSIADAAVIGVHSEEQATELPKAFIVPKSGLGFSISDKVDNKKVVAFKEEIVGWVKEKVASHKQLRGGIEIIEVVPKSPAGKILRKNLRANIGFATNGPGAVKAKPKL